MHSLAALRVAAPLATEAMVKLNEGVSGGGTPWWTSVACRSLGHTTSEPRWWTACGRWRSRTSGSATRHTCPSSVSVTAFVEERITGAELRSPSVQLRVTPLGEVELLSTHDQILGGPSGQSYLGARFPADRAYAGTIAADALRVGAVLAGKGVLGRFAIDFVVVRDGEGWTPFAIEINLRRAGPPIPS